MNKIIKMLLILLLMFNMFFAYNTIKILEKEVINLNDFTDYYTESEADNGGYQLLSSDFKVYEKKYIIVSEEKQEESTKRSKVIYYKVVSGDTLGGISNKFAQSQMVLKYNNPNIEKDLKIDEELKITPGNSISYRVVKGDSLSGIAIKFEKTVEELKTTNNLASNTIRLNQTLIINNPKIDLAKISKNKKEFDVYWPVPWKGITSPFGRRFHPVLKRWIGHMGVDLRAHYVDVKSSESGTIKYAGWMSGYGKIIIIRHSKGYETRYAHLNKIKVNKGQRVARGQLIAESGKTGRVTGPHLHYEIRKNGTPINPMKFFK